MTRSDCKETDLACREPVVDQQTKELAMEHLGGTAEQRAHLPGCATTYRHEDDPPVRCDCR